MATPKKQSNQKISQRAANAVAATKSQTPNVVSNASEQKSKTNDETMPMSKMNYILMGVSLFLIVLGFFLMSGSSNEGSTFNNDVFSSTRIVVAPFITFMGFLCMIPAILYKRRNVNGDVPAVNAEGSNAEPQGNIIVKNK